MKLMKRLLFSLAASSLAFQLQAADIKSDLTGEVSATFFQTSEKVDETVSYTDMVTNGVIGYTASIENGGTTTDATLVLAVDEEGGVEVDEMTSGIENETMAYRFGQQDPSGSAVGGDYMGTVLDEMDEAMAIGETIGTGNYLTVNVKDLALNLVVGYNEQGDPDAEVETDSTDDTVISEAQAAAGEDGAYQETVLAAFMETEIGAATIAASLTQVMYSIDEKRNAYGKDTSHDGGGATGIAVGVGYDIGAAVINFNLDQMTEKSGGDPAPDDVTTLTTVLGADIPLGDDMGVSAAFNMMNTDDGSSNKTEHTGVDVGFSMPVGDATFEVAYATNSTKDDDDDLDETVTRIGANLFFEF